jgi:hypothetical protein
MILSNIPASDIMPKKVIEKIKRVAISAVSVTPIDTNSPISVIEKPAIKAITTGTMINAMDGTVFDLRSKIIIIIMVKKPIYPNIV